MQFHPVALTGDIKQAFLQVRIRESDRDALRFHWSPDAEHEIETLRFIRALFRLTLSPFLLGGVLDYHMSSWQERKPELIAELKKSHYEDDLVSGKPTIEEAKVMRRKFQAKPDLLFINCTPKSQSWKTELSSTKMKHLRNNN